MCTNATKTAASLMAAIEPTLKSILTFTNLINTPQGQDAIKAYDAALAALQAWKSGTPAEDVLQLVGDFQQVFNALPMPANVSALVNIILAGIETVIGVVMANAPAPVTAAMPSLAHSLRASPEESHAMHQAHVIADTTAKVTTLVPGFKRSIWHSPASQYAKAWNEGVTSSGLPDELKTAA